MGETATATFLFTDVVGSTDLRSRLGDDAADALQTRLDETIAGEVESRRGRVVKRLGDGLMAVFPTTGDALGAAMAIQGGLAGSDEGVAVRIGVNSGEVSHQDGDYSGLPVVVAARLCDLASAGEVLTTGVVKTLVGNRGGFGFALLGPQRLKGIAEPVDVWRVGEEQTSDPVIYDSRVPFPSMLERLARIDVVGRGDAMVRLDGFMEAVERGEREVVLLAGEPGIGKSALASVFANKSAEGGAVIVAGRSPSETVASYQPFIEIIRQIVDARPRLIERIPGAGELARLVPDLAGRLSLPPGVQGEPGTQRYVLFEAFTSLIHSLAEEAPVVVVLDDLHWADESSLALFQHMCSHPVQASVLILGTYRDTDLARAHPLSRVLGELRRERRYRRLDLAGLGQDEVAAFLASRVGAPTSDRAVEEIFTETEGNPFFVEEVLAYLLESGAIDESGEWKTSESIETLGVPEGVRDVIGRRLDQLDEDTNRTLATAAVIGRDFAVEVLTAVVGEPEVVEDHLDAVVRIGLVVDEGGGRFGFSHALIRQTLYEEIPPTRRSRLHREVAQQLAATGAPPGELANHFAAGNDLPEALRASVMAATAAEEVFAFDEAKRHLDLALELWDEVDDAEQVAGLDQAGLYHRAAEMTHLVESGKRPVELIEQAIELVDGTTEQRRLGLLNTRKANFLWWAGEGEAAVRAAELAVQLIPPDPPSSERAAALGALSRLLYLAGHLEEGEAMAQEAIVVARVVGDRVALGYAINTLGVVRSEADDMEGGLELLEEAKTIAAEESRIDDQLRAYNNRASVLFRAGKVREYQQESLEGYELATRYGVRASGAYLLGGHLTGLLHLGRWDEAEELLPLLPDPEDQTATSTNLARAGLAIRRGNFPEAHRVTAAMMAQAEQVHEPQARGIASSIAAEFAFWEGRYRDALRVTMDAVAEIEKTDDRWFISWMPRVGLEAIRALVDEAGQELENGRHLVDTARLAAKSGMAHTIATGAHAAALWAGISGSPDPDLWERAADAWESLSMPYEVAWVRAGYAEDLYAMGQPSEARGVLDMAEDTAQRLRALPLLERLISLRQRIDRA